MKILNAKLFTIGNSSRTTIPRDLIKYQGGCKDSRVLLAILSADERHRIETLDGEKIEQ